MNCSSILCPPFGAQILPARQQGFTLSELLLTLSVITVLSIFAASTMRYSQRAIQAQLGVTQAKKLANLLKLDYERQGILNQTALNHQAPSLSDYFAADKSRHWPIELPALFGRQQLWHLAQLDPATQLGPAARDVGLDRAQRQLLPAVPNIDAAGCLIVDWAYQPCAQGANVWVQVWQATRQGRVLIANVMPGQSTPQVGNTGAGELAITAYALQNHYFGQGAIWSAAIAQADGLATSFDEQPQDDWFTQPGRSSQSGPSQ